MHISASVQTQPYAPRAVKHNLQEERKIIYLFNCLPKYRKQEWKELWGKLMVEACSPFSYYAPT